MRNEQVVAVVVRAIGLWLLVRSLVVVVSLIPFMLSSTRDLTLVSLPLIWLFLGVLLTWRPLSVAQCLLPNVSPVHHTTTWSLDEFQAVLFGVLGAYFLVTTITDLGGWFRVWSSIQNARHSTQPIHFHELTYIGTIALKLGAGIWLLLGARGLRNVIRKVRTLGAER